ARAGRGEEDVSDLEEERRPELFEEADAVARESHLRRRRELLANAAHRLRGRPTGDLAAVAEHDVARPSQGELVRNAGAYRPGGSRRERVVDQRLRSDEDVETLDEIRLDALERRVGDLEPSEVGRVLADNLQDLGRDRVAAHTLELVEVERLRRASTCGRDE